MKVKNNTINSLNDDDYSLVTWDDSFATGILLIDNQHMELVRITNELFNACLAGKDKAGSTFKEIMTHMVDYVRLHFSTEHELMERINYPDYKNHKTQHDMLIKQILEAADEFNKGNKFVPNFFVRTLKEWILSHVAVYDKDYALFVQDQKKKGLLTDAQIEG